MTNNTQTANNPGVARAPEGLHPGDEEADTPPDKISGTDAATRQKGQPGLPDSENKEWSPGSDQKDVEDGQNN
jgi:hypothetical protein